MLKECPQQFEVQLLMVIQRWFKSHTNMFVPSRFTITMHLQCIYFHPERLLRSHCFKESSNQLTHSPPKDLTRTSTCDYTTFPTSWRCCLLRLTHLGREANQLWAGEAEKFENISATYLCNLSNLYMIHVIFFEVRGFGDFGRWNIYSRYLRLWRRE